MLHGLAAILTGIIDGMGLQLVIEPHLLADESIWQAIETGFRISIGGKL